MEEIIIIEPNRSLFRFPWRELLHYRDLLFLLVRRDFIAKYKQTVLGPLWFIIQPLMTTIVFTVVFGKIAQIPTDKLPPLLFYLCGMLPWSYFSKCLNGTAGTFINNAHLFGKVYFPRLVVPLSVVISSLLMFAIQLGTFLVFWIYFKWFTAAGDLITPGWAIIVLPLFLIQSAALGLGVGLWMTALSAKYRDFSYLGDFLTQLWLYATPVVYPLSAVPERWRWVSAINPMSAIVEIFRYAFLGAGTVNGTYIGISAGMTLIMLISGLLIFNKVERTFIDTV